jgi:hypothetical protein
MPGLVKHEAARAGKPAHITLLIPIGHQFEFVGLQTLHGLIMLWSMRNNN